MLRDPVRVSVTPVAKTADRVRQSVIHIEPQRKSAVLVELFADPAMARTLVFTRTKRGADKVARHLEAAGINVAAIHGNKSQKQREAALAAFRAGRIRGLVATDIAARGIDIDAVTHVINYELPHVPESYVHRIGRTARAGAEGIAISLCGGEERGLLRDIERLTRQSIPSTDRTSPGAHAYEHAERRPASNGNGAGRGHKPAAKHAGQHPAKHSGNHAGKHQAGGGGRNSRQGERRSGSWSPKGSGRVAAGGR
jgi:ATP-dependent RNA helicase RhlE